jgi:hypothetical protein
MIALSVKSIWQGKCAIRDFYIDDAMLKKTGLHIKYEGEIMEIPFGKIKEKIVARSKKSFLDRFSGKFHYLYYFDWRPTMKQEKLF